MAAAQVSQAPMLQPKPSAPVLPQSAPLSPEQIAIIKATAPVLKEHGVTITTLFYKNMIDANPELRNIFSSSSQANGRQPRALAQSVLAYATYIDDLPKLQHAVERIAQKHVSLTIQPAQYDIVGKYLMEAIGIVLGDAATPAIVDAWTNAYNILASVFIGREAELYRAHENWTGFRKFKILRKEREADRITSFYLTPKDGQPLPKFLPGQYISVQVFVPELGHLQSRQYSLSEAPEKEGAYYRISVKREHDDAVDVDGLISNMLHDKFNVGDEVELTHPQGEFLIDPADPTKEGVPGVFISAGVGATPLLSMLDSLTQSSISVRRPVSWLHTSRSKESLPFGEAVQRIQERNKDQVSTHVFLREDRDARFDLLNLEHDKDLFTHNNKTEYFICGPESFMLEVRQTLQGLGVARERIFLELFQTGDVIDD